MSEEEKNKIRPIYRELQACLSQAPALGSNSDISRDSSLWEQLNHLVDEIVVVTSSDKWLRFKIVNIKTNASGWRFMYVSDYRTKLNSLIERLYGTYFFNEPAPFSGSVSPSTVITQNQSQSIDVQFLLDTQSRIDAELPKHEKGTAERSFLEKLKSILPTLKQSTDLLASALKIGEEFGLDPGTIRKLLGM